MRNMRGMALLTLALLVSLTGCQLAREDAGAQVDRMIGALVTLEKLERFIPERDADAMRLYAAQDEQGRYAFEGVRGSCILAAANPMYDDISLIDEVAYVEENHQENWFDDVEKGYACLDDGEHLTVEATIWLEPAEEAAFLYVNPVYLAADGRVYAAPAESAYDFSLCERGEATTLEWSETYATTRDGQRRSVEATVRLTFGIKDPAERVAVLQMSADNRVVDRREYAPGELPEDIAMKAGAAWLLVESHTRDERGNEAVVRSAYNRSDDFMKVFIDGDGVCALRTIELNWK